MLNCKSEAEFEAQLAAAGSKLVVVEVGGQEGTVRGDCLIWGEEGELAAHAHALGLSRLQATALTLQVRRPINTPPPPPRGAPATRAHALMHPQIESELVCQTGLDEEAELHWKADQAAALEPCSGIKHTFARTARACPDAVFLAVDVSEA